VQALNTHRTRLYHADVETFAHRNGLRALALAVAPPGLRTSAASRPVGNLPQE
jgi:hypothetical protein